MRKKIKRITIFTVAWLFLIFGVIGLALPFLQGFLFIAIGLILLSLVSPRMRAFLDTHSARYPSLHKVIMKVEGWVVRMVGET